MARAKFDRTEVVAAATALFGRRGYSAASMQDVFKVTGLQPGSLYNAFGSKDGLFEESIRHFGMELKAEIGRRFQSESDEMVAICGILSDFAREPCSGPYQGCFLVKAQLEMASIGNERLARVVADQVEEVQELITVGLCKHFDRPVAEERAVSIMVHIFGLRIYGHVDQAYQASRTALEQGLPWLPWDLV